MLLYRAVWSCCCRCYTIHFAYPLAVLLICAQNFYNIAVAVAVAAAEAPAEPKAEEQNPNGNGNLWLWLYGYGYGYMVSATLTSLSSDSVTVDERRCCRVVIAASCGSALSTKGRRRSLWSVSVAALV